MDETESYYYDLLYPFQDQALQVITSADTGFYLTGGTAISRVYLQHRYSDDNAENLLANKLSALIGCDEPRDIADVWGLCTKLGVSLSNAIDGAQSKATGIYPLDLARKLCTVTRQQWEVVRWINAPDPGKYIAELNALGEDLIIV